MPDAATCPLGGPQTIGLGLQQGGVEILHDVTVSLPADGVSMIMGPNGAGKSIFLRILHGLLHPTYGAVQHPDGHDRSEEAMVFQRPVLLRRSVDANLRFAIGKTKTRVDHATLLHRVGLERHAAVSAHALSGGERQRLALACALARRPRLLFLDEPSANLDPASTAQIEEVVREEARGGTKIVFVTHDIGQARRLADDVLFFHKGRLVEHTPAPDFFDHPRSSTARAFLAGELLTD